MPPKDIDPDINPPIDPKHPHRYFFTYMYRPADATGFGFGSYATSLRLPMRGVDDVLFVSEQIRHDDPTLTGIVIISWQKFED